MEDKQEILQALIDSNQLNRYFHADVLPDRIPLRMIKGPWYEEGIRLTKFGQPVQFIADVKVKEPYLDVMAMEFSEGRATLRFRYPPEGLAGNVTLEKDQQRWIVKSLDIRER